MRAELRMKAEAVVMVVHRPGKCTDPPRPTSHVFYTDGVTATKIAANFSKAGFAFDHLSPEVLGPILASRSGRYIGIED